MPQGPDQTLTNLIVGAAAMSDPNNLAIPGNIKPGINVEVRTTEATDGNSGDVTLQTGTASGTRGNIVLDGPMIKRGSGQWYADPGVGFDIECSNGATDTNADGVYIQGGNATGNGNGGTVFVQAGDGGDTGGGGGTMGIQGGSAHVAGATGGNTVVVGGQGLVADAIGGLVDVSSGNGQGIGASGIVNLHSGTSQNATSGQVQVFSGDSSAGSSGVVRIATGTGLTGNSGDINIETGSAPGGTRGIVTLDGSEIVLESHNGNISIALAGTGNILLGGIPTADPHVLNAIWNNSGVLHISAG